MSVMHHTEIEGPVWTNHCEHSADSYVTSFTVFRRNADNKIVGEETIDLYVYCPRGEPQRVCLRFGEEGGDYYSAGDLWSLMNYAHRDPAHTMACEALRRRGHFSWTPNVEEEPCQSAH